MKKNCQAATADKVPNPVSQTEEKENQLSVAKPSHSKEGESTNLDATDDVVSSSASKDVMSAVQPTDDVSLCASKDVMCTIQSEVCNDASKDVVSTNQSDECGLRMNASKDVMNAVQHEPSPIMSIQTECDSAGSGVIGRSSTNQETEESCAKPKFKSEHSSGGYITKGGRVIQAQHFRNLTYRGRGEGVTKPAFSISDRRNVQQSRMNNQYSRGETESDFLTPTKRKLIQNNNTGTLRMIFEADTSSLPRVGVVVVNSEFSDRFGLAVA